MSIFECTQCDEPIPNNNGFVSTSFGRYAMFCCEQCKEKYERRMLALAQHRRAMSLGRACFNGS